MKEQKQKLKVTACGLYPAYLLAGVDDQSAPNEIEIEACRRWLRLYATPTKTIRRKHGSYGYKHKVEAWTRTTNREFHQVDPRGRAWVGEYLYISNGAFIEAAHREGYRFEPCSPGSPNAFFNFSLT